MAHDVFISYPHQDKAVADAACAKLEAQGVRYWIAPRDIAPSAEWAASIVEAIDECKLMVLIFSSHANQSRQVRREVQQAFDGEKAVVPFRIENVTPEIAAVPFVASWHLSTFAAAQRHVGDWGTADIAADEMTGSRDE